MTYPRGSLFFSVGFAILVFLTQTHLRQIPSSPRQTALSDFVVTEYYVQDIASVMLGARRMGADLAVLQLMQYYGVDIHIDRNEATYSPLKYATFPYDTEFRQLVFYGFRILRLDPLFTSAVLDVAGALAFNEDRVDESLELLGEAIDRDPTYHRYALYVTAILYKTNGQNEKLVEKLDEIAAQPDCPELFLHVLANLHKKNGHEEKADALYRRWKETRAP